MIISEDKCKRYNIWNQIYSKESFEKEVLDVGFQDVRFYDDVRGNEFTGKSDTICGVFRK